MCFKQKGGPTSKGTGSAENKTLQAGKTCTEAEVFLLEGEKQHSLKNPRRVRMAPRQKEGAGTTPLSFLVFISTSTGRARGRATSQEHRLASTKLSRDPAKLDSLCRAVETSPQQHCSAALRCDGERLLTGLMNLGTNRGEFGGATLFHVAFH